VRPTHEEKPQLSSRAEPASGGVESPALSLPKGVLRFDRITPDYLDNAPSAARKIASKFSRSSDLTARSTAFSAIVR